MSKITDGREPPTQHPAPSTQHLLDRARDLLKSHWGFPDFRPAQAKVVRSILAGRDTLAILPTGGGKSLCFQVPALVLDGLTIVVSPLLALMQDQVNALTARGIPAAALNSLLKAPQQAALMDRVKSGELKLLYVSPERLDRLATDLATAKIRPRLLAIDEAHCLAEWGHDFRPAYRKLGRLRWKLGKPQVVALTGSATVEVRDDIARTLHLGGWGHQQRPWDLHLGSFDRSNLWFGVVPVRSERERWERLYALLKVEDRSALVYVSTRGLAEGLARSLTAQGIRAAPFHAGLPTPERKRVLQEFLEDGVEVVVATCAFGMGIDKPTVRLVVHWTLPPTPESYYQEAGRAGRDGRPARCVLLHHPADAMVHRRQLDVTFPPRDLCERRWGLAPAKPGEPAPTRSVLESIERLRRELRPERGGVDWRPVRERQVRAGQRLAAIQHYAASAGCKRAALLAYFGESLPRCAGCDHCRGGVVDPPADREAQARFRALRSALAPLKAPWGGAVLEPEILARLADAPPVDARALAATPGVGPELTARLGGRILAALGVTPLAPPSGEGGEGPYGVLVRWRAARALAEGVAEWEVLLDPVLAALAAEAQDPEAAVAGAALGPRARAAYGAELVALLQRSTLGSGGSGVPADSTISSGRCAPPSSDSSASPPAADPTSSLRPTTGESPRSSPSGVRSSIP